MRTILSNDVFCVLRWIVPFQGTLYIGPSLPFRHDKPRQKILNAYNPRAWNPLALSHMSQAPIAPSELSRFFAPITVLPPPYTTHTRLPLQYHFKYLVPVQDEFMEAKKTWRCNGVSQHEAFKHEPRGFVHDLGSAPTHTPPHIRPMLSRDIPTCTFLGGC